jgi:hypothetical protein
MAFSPIISTVAETIQTAIAPVFLLTGIAGMLNVLTGRLSRIVDRVRALEALHPRSTGPEHDRHVWELRILDKRISVINNALALCVMSAVAICMVVAGLFVAELTDLHIGRFVAIAFIFSMTALVAGLVLFLIEVRYSLRAIHVRSELLEHDIL